jgi:hypothetical protein
MFLVKLGIVFIIVVLKGKPKRWVNDYGFVWITLIVLAGIAHALGHATLDKVFGGILLFGAPILSAIDQCKRNN